MSLRTGRIYKIVSCQSNHVYVGSTFGTLRDRFYKHKISYNQWLNNNHSEISIYPFFKLYGIENFKMILIKEYQVCDKNHLEAYEQLWISKLKCVNKHNTVCIKKLTNRKYWETNKEDIIKK